MNELVKKAEAIARQAHAGQLDKSGKPCIGHVERVAARVTSDEAKCVAWLHDVLEDTDALTIAEMHEIFGEDITNGVISVTRWGKERYDDFIRRARANPLGREVKIADLIDNSNLSRLNEVTVVDALRQRKYSDALLYLLEAE